MNQPRESEYRDDGCEVHPACLSCPLVRCRYDEPVNQRRAETAARIERQRQVRLLEQTGKSSREIAMETGFALRTVQRTLSRRAS